MPSSNVSRALHLYQLQVSGSASSSSRNEARKFAEQSRKTRQVLVGDEAELPFAEVLRKLNSEKH